MFKRIKRLFGTSLNVPAGVAVLDAQAEQITTLLVNTVELQLVMAEKGSPAMWSKDVRATVLGYIAASCKSMTGDPGGPRTMLVCVSASERLLGKTFSAKTILDEFETLAISRHPCYLRGAEAGYGDMERRAKKLPLLGLLAALQ